MNFYDDPVKVDEYEKMCEEYDGSELYAVLETHLKEQSTILELGTGPGIDLSYLKNKYQITGSDLSKEFLNRNITRHPDLKFLELDAVAINTEQSFDSIFSNKVLHHLTTSQLEQSLRRQQEVIAKNGVFAHTFWLGDKEFTMEGMLFVFHNREALLDLISKYFSIIELYTYKEFEEGDSILVVARNDKYNSN